MPKFLDWKGNEIKPGMTIYFVRTKNMPLKFGIIIPAGISVSGECEEQWESEESYQERMNEEVWELGYGYEVTETDKKLFITMTDGEYSYRTPLSYKEQENSVVAIKGVSDKK